MTGLSLKNLSLRYGRTMVVDDVSLDVAPGEVVCLLGPSGCGKTSCLNMAAGLVSNHGGTVTLKDRVLAGPGVWVPPEKRRIGLMQQSLALFPHMTVRQNVAFGIKGRDKARADALIAQVGLSGREGAYPHQLSGGQQQRVALARTLAPSPDAILLDEAFSALDATLRQDIRAAAITMLKEAQTPVLLVTHDPEEALHMADRIAVMREGRLVQAGTPAELRENPADIFVLRFFGEVNLFRAPIIDQQVNTPFGALQVNGLAADPSVRVAFLPDCLHLDKQGVEAHVTAMRPASGGWRISLTVPGLTQELVMVTPDTPAVGENDCVRVAARLERMKVFKGAGSEPQPM